MPQDHPMNRTPLPKHPHTASQNVALCCLLWAGGWPFLTRHQIITEGGTWHTISRKWKLGKPLPQRFPRENQTASGQQQSAHEYGALSRPEHSEFWKKEQRQGIKSSLKMFRYFSLHFEIAEITWGILEVISTENIRGRLLDPAGFSPFRNSV